jgi:hypothetical protein
MNWSKRSQAQRIETRDRKMNSMHDYAPFRQNLLRDSATQGSEQGTEQGAESGA